jgi:tetratricopeptide (TPR) repeat protein
MNTPSDETLFAEALARPAAERAAYLDQACANDPEKRARLETLLRVAEPAQGFLEPPATVDARPAVARPAEEKSGDVIGNYKVLQKLGEGGCGVVYMADQEEPVRRRVALKVIKLGMDTKEVIARFEAERQALAMMDHPNIAKVLDAGATATGRPFFVMELVRGIPLTKFCDENNLPTADRLQLFTAVCHAIQHAHQKGIIHRDIKPSNILVTLHDGEPVPKVIDFGIAKATAGRLTDNTLFTAFEQFIGTPAYMSPEQAELSGLDIDTRSDIYSLGVLLYELLTGRTPFDTSELLKVGLDTMRRHIREVDPPKPSTRLSTMQGEALTAAAKLRQIAPPKLINLIRGDLDWIVMKALEKNRSRRYETANAFADDIARHLASQPVTACPPSATYRLGKMVRRHKLGFAAGAAVAAALVIGLSLSTWMFFREKAARERAVAAEQEQSVQRQKADEARAEEKLQRSMADQARQYAEQNLKKAEEEAAISRAVSSFLTDDILRQADSSVQLASKAEPDPDLKVREALDRAAEKVGPRFMSQPQTEAAVRSAIGAAYSGVGEHAKAAKHFERTVELKQATLGAEHPDTLRTMMVLAAEYSIQNAPEKARPLREKVLEAQKRTLGPEHRDTLFSLTCLAMMYRIEGKNLEAAALASEVWKAQQRVLGPEHPATLVSVTQVIAAHQAQGRDAEAGKLAAEAVEMQRRVFGPKDINTLYTMTVLARAHLSQGRLAEAAALAAEAFAALDQLRGPANPDTRLAISVVGEAYVALGKRDEAVGLLSRAYEAKKRTLGPEHPDTLRTMMQLANTYSLLGWSDKSRPLRDTVYAMQKRVLGPEHPDTLATMAMLVASYLSQSRYSEAEALATGIWEIRKRVTGPEHPDTLGAMSTLADVYSHQGKHSEAVALLQRALEIWKRIKGPEHPDTLNAMDGLALVLRLGGRAAEAAAMRTQVVEVRTRVNGPEHQATRSSMIGLAAAKEDIGEFAEAEIPLRALLALAQKAGADDLMTASHRTMLGRVLLKQQRYAEAEAMLRPAWTLRDEKQPKHWTTFVTRYALGGALVGQAKYAEAEPLLLSAQAGLLKRVSVSNPEISGRLKETMDQLVQLYTAWGKPEQAAAWQKKLDEFKAGEAAKAGTTGP